MRVMREYNQPTVQNMQHFIHLVNQVCTGNCELADFSVRKSYFPASLKGTREGQRKRKNGSIHLVSLVLKPEKNLIILVFGLFLQIFQKRNKFSIIVDKEWFVDGHEKVLLICDFITTNILNGSEMRRGSL